MARRYAQEHWDEVVLLAMLKWCCDTRNLLRSL